MGNMGYDNFEGPVTEEQVRQYLEKKTAEYLRNESWNYLHSKYPKGTGESKSQYRSRMHELHETEGFKAEFDTWVKQQEKYKELTNPDAVHDPQVAAACRERMERDAYLAEEEELRKEIRRWVDRSQMIDGRVEGFVEYLESRSDLLLGMAQELADDAAAALKSELMTSRLYADTGRFHGYEQEDLSPQNLESFFSTFLEDSVEFITDYMESFMNGDDLVDRMLPFLKKNDPEGYEAAMTAAAGDLDEEATGQFLSELPDIFSEDGSFGWWTTLFIDRAAGCIHDALISTEDAVGLIRQNPHFQEASRRIGNGNNGNQTGSGRRRQYRIVKQKKDQEGQ